MLQFLPGQWAEGLPQPWLAEITEHHLNRKTSRLAFAMGMVNQNVHGAGIGLLDPAPARGCFQPANRSD